MRNLIDILDNLAESRGLSAREPGEEFVRTGGTDQEDVIVFQGLQFYPESGAYDSAEEMMQVFDQLKSKLRPGIEPINRPSAGTRAFAIATFDTAVGRRYLAKFAKEINPIRTKNTFFQTADIPGGFTYKTARGEKETVGYKPSQVLTEFKSQTPESIYQQIMTKFGEDSPIGQATRIFYEATDFPIIIPGDGIDFNGFRDYFCEMLQPVALIQGKPVTGNAGKAAEVFLGDDYSDCVVSFNEGVSGALFDSLLVAPNGKQIKLSSKGAKGAMASVINLLKSARELREAGMGDIVDQYQDVIDILETIEQGDHWTGPIMLATQLGLITEAEASSIIPTLKPLTTAVDIRKVRGLTDNLRQIYNDRSVKDAGKTVPLEHMVASLAYKVCNEINTRTNFSEAAADILNNSAFVQMYTEAAKKGTDIIIKGFRTVWPSKLFTDVTLEAQKSYSSTSSSGGKLVFNINKEPRAVPNTDTSAGAQPGTDQDIADYIPARSDLKAADTQKKTPDDAEALGRRRRKSF
jgi:hypothetical protein